MPPVAVMPVVAMPMVIAAHPARTVMRQHDPAMAVRVVVIIWRIAAMEVMPVAEAKAAAVEAASMEAAVESATMESTAMKPTAVEPAATMTTAAMTAPTMTTTPTMAAADLRDQPTGSVRARWHPARIDQRHRIGALAGRRRQHQDRNSHRNSSHAPAADKSAPGICNTRHCDISLNGRRARGPYNGRPRRLASIIAPETRLKRAT
jgi:hypothetical protein